MARGECNLVCPYEDRTHNDVNEIDTKGDAITEQDDPQQEQWATPVWSARGNMTTAPKPYDPDNTLTCVYDAWNRLVEVKDGTDTIAKYEYDGLNRRIKKHIDTAAPDAPDGVDTYRHMYYTTGWQLLETRDSGTENTEPETLNPLHQYVWSARYIDAPVLRDRDADDDSETGDLGKTGSGLEERLYYTTDANMNVTALLDTGGAAVEFYFYDAYGTPWVRDADWTSDDDGVSDYESNIRIFRTVTNGVNLSSRRAQPLSIGHLICYAFLEDFARFFSRRVEHGQARAVESEQGCKTKVVREPGSDA